MSNPLYKAFIDAGREAGYGVTDDYNGYRQEGFGPMHMTVRQGERCSTDLAYLAPARRRANLTVMTEAEVDRLTFAGLTVTGLRYRQKGLERSVKARKEVILSAGSVGSPHPATAVGRAQCSCCCRQEAGAPRTAGRGRKFAGSPGGVFPVSMQTAHYH